MKGFKKYFNIYTLIQTQIVIPQNRNLFITSLVVILPFVFLFLWIPPFSLIIDNILMAIGISNGREFYYTLTLEYAPPFFYTLLFGGMILNLGNAIYLYTKQRFENMQSAFLRIRLVSAFSYPALLWGILWGIFFLMGPERNVHILLLISFSLIALNLSGAFYAIPLILQLKKEQKIGLSVTIFCIIFSVIIGLDLLITLFVRKKLK